MSVKSDVVNSLKNVFGWKTNRKIVVFSVDDYGNVRVGSRMARENMDKAGLKVFSRFDYFDALETREDLEMLFEALCSVKGMNGQHAIFTPFALACNINFEKVIESGFEDYFYELLPETYEKLKGYEGAWQLWQEGIKNGIMVPQFHGREHLNLKVFNYLLKQKSKELQVCLANRSYTSISARPFKAINYAAAFDFQEFNENNDLQKIISDGLSCFEEVFGYKAVHFMPPTAKIHKSNFAVLKKHEIQYIDIGLLQKQHQGNNLYATSFNYSGKRTTEGQTLVVRNCVFEPTEAGMENSIQNCLAQMKAAFRLNKPAIISSHRVNFCGHIDPENRKIGIQALRKLLQQIVHLWPDVEFMSTKQLFHHMKKEEILK